jgi:phosphoesterase RecJ-like protein
MQSPIDILDQSRQIVHLILSSERIVVTSHKGPDGDSIGSSMALYHFIQSLGKDAVVCHPDTAPRHLTWMKGAHDILHFEHQPDVVADLLLKADLIFCLDYNAPDRLGKDMGAILSQASGKKVMIDHHLHPDDFCEITLSETSTCSTSQLIYEVIDQSGSLHLMNKHIGEAIYLGIMTDSGSFRFPSVQPRTHEIIAEVMRQGVLPFEIHEKVFDTNTFDRLQLRSHAVANNMELLNGYPVAIMWLTHDELQRYNYQKGDTDGLVNVALSVQGVQAAALFMEKDGVVKISFRSKGDYFVNVLANEHFSGGGHKYAAGGVSEDGLSATIERFKSIVPIFF